MLFISGSSPTTVKKKIDKTRLSELDSSTLVDLIKDYMSENQELRKENQDLFNVRDLLLRDQELVCKENERLLKKIEEVNSVCCRCVGHKNTYCVKIFKKNLCVDMSRSQLSNL